MNKLHVLTTLFITSIISIFISNSAFAANALDAADGSPTNAVYVDNDGNVGIGTMSPSFLLSLGGTNSNVFGVENTASFAAKNTSGLVGYMAMASLVRQ